MLYEEIEEASYKLAEEHRAGYGVVQTREVSLFDITKVDRLMEGAIDIHIHPGPDAWATRPFDDIDIAIEACKWGMGAVVYKSHSYPSARSGVLVNKVVEQWAKEHGKKPTKVISGTVLNYNAGGLNPEIVRSTATIGGKVIWMPNLDASHHIKLDGGTGGIEVIDDSGKVLPELEEIFRIIAKYDMMLSLGHQSTRERFIMIDAAKKAGVKRIEIVHPYEPCTRMTMEQMKMATEMGAYLGIYCTDFHMFFSMDWTIEVIKEVGPDHIVLGTDLGNWKWPHPVLGYRRFLGMLLDRGVPEADIQKMARINAEKLIF